MTKTGKHPTNIAGEWKEDDLIMHRGYLYVERVMSITKNYIRISSERRRVERIKLEEKCHYLNITEMQRALGRV